MDRISKSPGTNGRSRLKKARENVKAVEEQARGSLAVREGFREWVEEMLSQFEAVDSHIFGGSQLHDALGADADKVDRTVSEIVDMLRELAELERPRVIPGFLLDMKKNRTEGNS